MVIMHGLRGLTELSFYYAFASFVAVCGGSRYALAGLILQAVCFTLSAVLEKNRMLRMAALVPMALFWLLPDVRLADTLLYIPPAIYVIRLSYSGAYSLDWGRHVELFSVFWKAYTPFAFLLLLIGMLPELAQASMPIALIMLVGSVLLMRSLRHEPETYCQKWYQFFNAATVTVVLVIAALMSTKAFLETCAAALAASYRTFVLPLLMLALTGFVYILRAVVWLVSLLNIRLPENQGEAPELQLDGIAEDLGLDKLAGEPVGEKYLIALCILMAVVVLYFFFRWMMRLGWGQKQPPEAREERLEMDGATDEKVRKARPGSAVQRVRAQYRKFLKFYISSGGELDSTYTSLDVEQGAKRRRFMPENLEELRGIYIRARYGERAEAKDVSRAKELYTAMKREHRTEGK